MSLFSNKIFEIKEGYKMLTGQYRIEPIVYSKTIMRYSDILVRRRRYVDEKKLARLIKAIETFNRLVEEINY